MKHSIWLALLPGLLLASGEPARQADSPGASATPDRILAAPASPPPPSSADDACREAILALDLERQAYIQVFDWNRPGDSNELARGYARAMDDFYRRELELKRDWYQATGQLELLAQVEASLERVANPDRVLPELEQARDLPSGTEVTQ
jgi:hypothetical protein